MTRRFQRVRDAATQLPAAISLNCTKPSASMLSHLLARPQRGGSDRCRWRRFRHGYHRLSHAAQKRDGRVESAAEVVRLLLAAVGGASQNAASPSMAISWPAYPFQNSIDRLPIDDIRRTGTFSSSPAVLAAMGQPIIPPTLTPDTKDLAILTFHYPTAIPSKPPWDDIRADLLAAGISVATITEVTSRDLVRMMDRIPDSKPSLKSREETKRSLIELFDRRGLAPLAYLIEAAWNVREWLREVDSDHTLGPVLRLLMPVIRRQVELNLIDAELSSYVTLLPRGNDLTAATLVAFIESLELAGGARISIPCGQPPEEAQWRTLARSRAMRIAMQVMDRNGNQLFDYQNSEDLEKIERMDRDVLVGLWRVIERLEEQPHGKSGSNASGTPQASPGAVEHQLDELVTLDQIAPLAGLSKRSLERHLKAGKLPQPDVQGGGGRAHKWLYRSLRPALIALANRELPEKFPGSRII